MNNEILKGKIFSILFKFYINKLTLINSKKNINLIFIF
jgi:hypothetical protein